MNFWGTCKVDTDIINKLIELSENISTATMTLTWLEKQSFFNLSIKDAIENRLKKIEQEKSKIINGIKKEAKKTYPNGKKIVVSYKSNEVKVYG